MKTGINALLAVLTIGYASTASAVPFVAVDNPPAPASSSVVIDVDAIVVGQTIGSIGPISVTGTVDADVTVDAEGAAPWQPGTGNGSLTFNGATLLLQDLSQTVVLQGLGTIHATLNGVGMTITSSAIPVVNNEWNIDTIGAPDSLTVGLNQGVLMLSNPTGTLAQLINPNDLPIVVDLNAEPLTVGLADLLGSGLGGTADSTTIGIQIPTVAATLLESPIPVFAVLSGAIYLQAVPEPSTYAMLGMGIVSLVAVGRRRFRKG